MTAEHHVRCDNCGIHHITHAQLHRLGLGVEAPLAAVMLKTLFRAGTEKNGARATDNLPCVLRPLPELYGRTGRQVITRVPREDDSAPSKHFSVRQRFLADCKHRLLYGYPGFAESPICRHHGPVLERSFVIL